MRGNGFRTNKSPYVYASPLEFISPSSEHLPLNSVLKQGSTMGGRVGLMTGTTYATPDFISASDVAAGSSASTIPVIRVKSDIELIVPQASSATVVSTTNIGNHVACCTSMTCVDTATTGVFVISGIYNTSAAAAQYFTGHFIAAGTTI